MIVKYKVSDFAKDLNLSAKKVLDELAAMGSTGKKNSSNLEENELNYLLEKFSKDNSVANLDEFLNSAKAAKEEPKPTEKKAEKKAAAPAEESTVDFTHEEEIDFDTFCKVELRVAEVRACENLKESKKLLHLTVFDGERERCILSGIAKWFKPEDLIGKKIMLVANLKPAKLCGVESCGMICAADMPNGDVKVIFPDESLPVGSKIR